MIVIPRIAAACLLLLPLALSSGCSVQRFVTDKLADTLAGSGTTYSSDNDPELVRDALPFSLKLMESVLGSAPDHRGLLTATSASFTQYAYGFIQQEADMLALEDTDGAWRGWNRARRLYLRARDYGLRGLDVALPGFSAELRTAHASAVARAGASEAELLYWTAVSWAAAISLGKDDPSLVAELPLATALIDRALAVDESWGRGAIHSFLVTFAMSRPDAEGDRVALARRHFDRAVQLSNGREVGPHLAWAESICIPGEDLACLNQSLAAALAIDPDAEAASRLVNTILQRRARWLQDNVDHWILPPLPDETSTENAGT